MIKIDGEKFSRAQTRGNYQDYQACGSWVMGKIGGTFVFYNEISSRWRKLVTLYSSVNKCIGLLLRALCGSTRNLVVKLFLCQLSFAFSYVEICSHNKRPSSISLFDHHIRSILQLT